MTADCVKSAFSDFDVRRLSLNRLSSRPRHQTNEVEHVTDWDGILRDHGPTVWRTLWRLLANRADCDECFQETFLAALKFARSPAASEGVRNWSALLQKLATARAVDRLRQRYQHKAAFDPAAAEDLDTNAVSHRPGPVELATASELSLRLRQALARLP